MDIDAVKTWDADFVVLGEPASAKNQRRIVLVRKKPRVIKSAKALAYAKSFDTQCPRLTPALEGAVALRLDVYYASRRPDLACIDLIQDLLQGHIYLNDRQVKASMSLWNLDRENPRVRVRVREIPGDTSQGVSSFTPSMIWGPENI